MDVNPYEAPGDVKATTVGNTKWRFLAGFALILSSSVLPKAALLVVFFVSSTPQSWPFVVEPVLRLSLCLAGAVIIIRARRRTSTMKLWHVFAVVLVVVVVATRTWIDFIEGIEFHS